MTNRTQRNLRVTDDLYERLLSAANAHEVSVNSEMCLRLEKSFSILPPLLPPLLATLIDLLPTPGTEWPTSGRERWLRAAQTAIEFHYPTSARED